MTGAVAVSVPLTSIWRDVTGAGAPPVLISPGCGGQERVPTIPMTVRPGVRTDCNAARILLTVIKTRGGDLSANLLSRRALEFEHERRTRTGPDRTGPEVENKGPVGLLSPRVFDPAGTSTLYRFDACVRFQLFGLEPGPVSQRQSSRSSRPEAVASSPTAGPDDRFSSVPVD
jgi:hypothetical protein